MATTKIWTVKDSLNRLIKYAENPEKTEFDDLRRELHYVENGKKTAWFEDEKVYLVTSLHCGNDPYESMVQVRNHFGHRGSILAFHAYQSFKPGEVTPEQCHAIGVELAKRLWGKDHQVVIASHLNCSHLHNHFIVNPISLIDGRKLDSGKSNYYRLREESDKICREHSLSVIQNPGGRTPRSIYFAEKAGEPTRYNLMRKAIDNALSLSPTWEDFVNHLHEAGYEFDRNEGGKYAKIKSLNATKWTRIYRLGEDYTLGKMDRTLMENRLGFHGRKAPYAAYGAYYKRRNAGISPPRQHWLSVKGREMGPLLLLTLTFVYLLGGPDLITPQNPAPRYQPITPEMKEATRRAEMYSRQAVLMDKEHINTKEDADAFLDRTEREIAGLERGRQTLYNSIRRCDDPEKIAQVKEKIHDLSAEMTPLRRQLSDIKNVLERSGVMEEMIKAEEKARREQIEREYSLAQNEPRTEQKRNGWER